MALSEKGKIFKNLLAFDVVFFLIFSAVNGVLSVQSVLNQEQGLGVLSSLVGFSVQLAVCLVIPQFISELFGFKWTLAISVLFYTLYIASNIYPTKFFLLSGLFIKFLVLTMENLIKKKHLTFHLGSVLFGMAQSLSWLASFKIINNNINVS